MSNINVHRYWGLDGGPVVSVWLALDDSQEENGALQVIPGTVIPPKTLIHTSVPFLNLATHSECTGSSNLELYLGQCRNVLLIMFLYLLYALKIKAPFSLAKQNLGEQVAR